jgi:TolB protein
VYAPTRFFDVSADGSLIGFVLNRSRTSNIFVADAQRTATVRQRTFRNVVSGVSLSADGRQFVFTDVRGQRRSVYLAGVSGGTAIRQISPAHMTEDQPSFSPDGRRIVYVRSEANPRGGTRPISSIVSLDLATGVTTHHGEGHYPSFFPDGRRILCSRLNAETGRSEIWIIDSSTGAEILVVALRDQDCFSPSLSPDGTTVAFATQSIKPSQPANFDIFVVSIDGGRPVPVTSHLAHDISPCWASDGRSLYVLSQRGNASGVWQVWKFTPANRPTDPASRK